MYAVTGTPKDQAKAQGNYRQVMIFDEKTCTKPVLEAITSNKLKFELMDK